MIPILSIQIGVGSSQMARSLNRALSFHLVKVVAIQENEVFELQTSPDSLPDLDDRQNFSDLERHIRGQRFCRR